MHVLKTLFTILVCCLISQSELMAQTDSARLPQDTARDTAPDPRSPEQNPVRPAPASQKPPVQARPVQTQPSSTEVVQQSVGLKPSDSMVRDSARRLTDTSLNKFDSVEAKNTRKTVLEKIAGFGAVLKLHPYYPFFGQPVYLTVSLKKSVDNDILFYFLCGLVLYFAILKLAFGKYLNNLFTLFFRVTMRQNQIREQLLQAPLPSLLLNILFAVSGGMYLNLILFFFGKNPVPGFWLSFSYCVGIISLLYLGKLLILKSMGWIFNVSNATNTYLFIVFLVNKMIGMFLLPFLFILAFPHPMLISGMITLSFILLIAMFFYRFVISYRPIHSEINVGRLHFIIYLCAFEIAPLLLIYKVLLIFVDRHN